MMTLRLFNTLTKTKEDFAPIDPANVRMYVCGPTVYDFAHIGNARPVIVFDVLFRLLRHVYGDAHVTYVRNITDVDDKINARALRDFPDLPLNQAIRNVTEKTEAQYHADVDALGCLRPTFEPRATEFILPRPDGKTDMVTLIQQLIARGHAYEAGGEVLFDIQSMPDYGVLSRRRLDEQQAGARVAVDAHKKHPHDFVLWKLSSDDEPGWESPWGRGRPGWHIECSAMSAAYLGAQFDIHGGGLDLIFPHHENEIAQSRCAHGTPVMANVWMHNGFLQVEGEKMSKSVGNFFSIHELLTTKRFGEQEWFGDALRFNMLRTHYRKPIDWTVQSLEESEINMYHWRSKADDVASRVISRSIERPLRVHPKVRDALLDDLNTPLAISELHQIEDAMGSSYDVNEAEFEKQAEFFITGLSLLGLYDGLHDQIRGERRRQKEAQRSFIAQQIEPLVEARNAARAVKNFAESDRIRDELLAQGVVLKDGPGGTTWEVRK
jgi:cysteinyl-tRNA synthetase